MAKAKKEEELKLNGYSLTHAWFEFVLENPDKVSGNHTALYLWMVQINNRCQWREKFQVTVRELMDGMACKSRTTYVKCFNDLIDWGFVDIRIKSKNQHQCNVISLYKKCTDTNQGTDTSIDTDTSQITGHIHKPYKLSKEINIPFDDFWDLYDKKVGKKEKLEKMWNKLTDRERSDIVIHVPRYTTSQPDKKYRKNPETYLNNESWNDEIPGTPNGHSSGNPQMQKFTRKINGKDVDLEKLTVNERKQLLKNGILTTEEFEYLNR